MPLDDAPLLDGHRSARWRRAHRGHPPYEGVHGPGGCGSRSVGMAMMQVGVVGVAVPQRAVLVPVGVRLVGRHSGVVGM